MRSTRTRRRLALVIGLVTFGLLAAPAPADVLVLKNGVSIDGKVMREDGGFIWVKTLLGVEKLNAAQVESRTEGESPFDAYERLAKAVSGSPKDAALHWELYVLLREHASGNKERDKERAKLLKKVLRFDADHAEARDENGEVSFRGTWVKKADLPRLKAEAERNRLKNEWSAKLGTPVEVYATDHFLLVDGTNDRDLAQRAESLDAAYARILELTRRESLWGEPSPTITMADHLKYLPVLDKMSKQWGMSAAWMKFAKLETGGGVWRDRPIPTQLRFPNRGVEGMWYSTVHMVGHLAVWKIWGGGKKPPTWMEEGLGQWIEFEVMGEHLASCVGGKTARAAGGTTDKRRKKKKKKGNSDDVDERKERCIEAIQNGSFPSMRMFLKMQIGDYGPAEEGGAYGLVTWLIAQDEAKFADFVKALKRGGLRDDDPWTQVYEYELIEEMEKVWKAWVLSEW